jgi:hypothetical protein
LCRHATRRPPLAVALNPKFVRSSPKVVCLPTKAVPPTTKVASATTMVVCLPTEVATPTTKVVCLPTKVAAATTQVVSPPTKVAAGTTKVVPPTTQVVSQTTSVVLQTTWLFGHFTNQNGQIRKPSVSISRRPTHRNPARKMILASTPTPRYTTRMNRYLIVTIILQHPLFDYARLERYVREFDYQDAIAQTATNKSLFLFTDKSEKEVEDQMRALIGPDDFVSVCSYDTQNGAGEIKAQVTNVLRWVSSH